MPRPDLLMMRVTGLTRALFRLNRKLAFLVQPNAAMVHVDPFLRIVDINNQDEMPTPTRRRITTLPSHSLGQYSEQKVDDMLINWAYDSFFGQNEHLKAFTRNVERAYGPKPRHEQQSLI